ncbi:MAG TPA: hypothetical protein VN688_26415 [Gemmataceae bacterium]|nr:hypothetical protein [Gemmataceae bacterium]
MTWKPSLPRRHGWIVCAALLVLAGCHEQEQIHSYLAPKESLPEPPRQRAKADQSAPHYVTPKGWEVRPPLVKKGIRIPVVLRVAQDGHEAEATGMSLPGKGGGLLPNVQRWCRQVGANPVDEAELRRIVRTVKVSDNEAQCVDLGPGRNGNQRILGAMLPHGKETWFFTLKGPADLVGKQKSNFEAFVASVHFGNEPGAAHE